MHYDKDNNLINPSIDSLRLFDDSIRHLGKVTRRYVVPKYDPPGWGSYDQMVIDMVTPEGELPSGAELLGTLIGRGYSEKHAREVLGRMEVIK